MVDIAAHFDSNSVRQQSYRERLRKTFEISFPDSDAVVLKLKRSAFRGGELTAEAGEALRIAVSAGSNVKLTIDLTHAAQDLDSMVGLVKCGIGSPGHTVFCNLAPRLEARLKVNGLLNFISTAPSLEAALGEDVLLVSLPSDTVQERFLKDVEREFAKFAAAWDGELLKTRMRRPPEYPLVDLPAFDLNLHSDRAVARCRYSQLNEDSDASTKFTLELRKLAEQAVAAQQGLVVDLCEVKYLGSQALGALVAAAHSMWSNNLKFGISGLKRQPQKVLSFSRLHTVIPVLEQPEDQFAEAG